jgi:hypothetical protein
MSSTSSYLDADLEYSRFRDGADLESSPSAEPFFTDDAYNYTTGIEQGDRFVDESRHGSFSSAGGVYSEHRSGTSTPAHHCVQCGWTTASSDNLEYHNRAHDGEVFFQCFLDGCEASFSQADDLIAHSQSRPHRIQVLSGQTNGRKRSWHEADEVDQWVERTPQKPNKRVCVEPITPNTPSTGFVAGSDGQASSISRRLSYEATLPEPPHQPVFARHASYHAPSTSTVDYEQASNGSSS